MPIISKETNMEDYVTFEQAVKLKELGFDWKVNHSYYTFGDKNFHESLPTPSWEPGPTNTSYSNLNELDICVSAPTMSQTQKWLRETKEILILIQHNKNFYWTISTNDSDDEVVAIYEYETYEKALISAINKALELLK